MTAPEDVSADEARLKLMSLYGQLQGVEGAVCETRNAVKCRMRPEDEKLIEHLYWLQHVLVRAQGLALLNVEADATAEASP